MNIVTQNMSALYVQGSNSGPATGFSSNTGSHSSASSSNSHSHAHIPAVTAGTITAVPCDSLASLPPPLSSQPYFSSQPQFQQPYYFPPPGVFPNESYGYGFSANSSGPLVSRSQSSNVHSGSFGNNYRGNNNYRGVNNYRHNNGFRGRGNYSVQLGGSRQSGNPNTWSGIVDNRTTVVIECQICNKRGHIAVNCFQRNTNMPITGVAVECQICGKRGHSALDCYHRGNYAYQGHPPPSSLFAMNAQQSPHSFPQDTWIVDSRQEDKGDSVPGKE